jgi:hypothetical protein
VNPGTDRAEMIICLSLEMCIVRMDQTQDQERIDQQIEAERRCGDEPERSSVAEWSVHELYTSFISPGAINDRRNTVWDHFYFLRIRLSTDACLRLQHNRSCLRYYRKAASQAPGAIPVGRPSWQWTGSSLKVRFRSISVVTEPWKMRRLPFPTLVASNRPSCTQR